MSRDYKQSGRKPAGNGSKRGGNGRSGDGGSSAFAGLFIGLCLGIAVAVAGALYFNKLPTGFNKKVQPPAPLANAGKGVGGPEMMSPGVQGGSTAPSQPAVLPAAQPPAPPAAPAAHGNPPAQEGDRFDFYTMLPELGGGEPKAQPPAKAADATPPASVVPPKGAYLQVGAFQNETDADNLKAKLALVGVEASITTTEIAGRGVMHRVRVGPLGKPEDIDRVRAQLKVNGVESTLVKQ
ncbi:SPOR domain-containing protein [Chitinimonas koreensis]|uniref:SPOR domain-containing protein n=1 Tax=Chitinimonas koreensis TaxID=356302 RepID=UPI00040234D0|nr:SPOR domain-containing protein [Chitinimonas koreensis]QNM96887.1 SPOR domain-containing protein [Chitinimonas koreensis]